MGRMFMVEDATPTPGQGESGFGAKKPSDPDAERRTVCYSVPSMLHEADRGEWADALERGRIVHFGRCPLPLPAPAEQEFLREGLGPFLRRKNVSYYPGA